MWIDCQEFRSTRSFLMFQTTKSKKRRFLRMKRKRNIRLVTTIFIAVALALFLPCLCIAGDLEPSAAPAPTMKTLDEIPPTWSQILPANKRFVELEVPCTGPICPIPAPIWGVLDKETGLVWEKSPSTDTYTWTVAQTHCYQLENPNGRKGWHLPTIEQLASLVDTSVNGSPKLPSGHPFTNVQSDFYWSATTGASYTTYAWYVHFFNGTVYTNLEANRYYVWCVRGGQGYDAY
jgi:hypothetical protein